MSAINTQLLRELITFGALGSLAEELTDKPADELLSAETFTQIDALMTAIEPFDRLTSTAELLALLDESAARIIALIAEGGDADVETDN
ncbi:hypothetical protein C162_25950 [Paenibacillus sp. FSL R7-269]|uniref:hypothetical protein n=1 Tax=Paenibacillus sp. FSL R7-269 TaxID=1226755 RepID=UPI0003E267B8|nr:hypothetical protein [Paenibacillus sp. FSL R7-269]ETT41581.1 hypothetical protein C162_25950 [Paenibacillus sp. FSL R7-269]